MDRGTPHRTLSCATVPQEPNKLLAALGARDFGRVATNLREQPLAARQVLFSPGEHAGGVYFPQTAIVVQQITSESGAATGGAMMGNHGVVALGACLAGGVSLTKQVVLIGGRAHWLDRHALLTLMDENTALRKCCAVSSMLRQPKQCRARRACSAQCPQPGVKVQFTASANG
jgi:hypothetical protein